MNNCGQGPVLRPQEVALTRATQNSQNKEGVINSFRGLIRPDLGQLPREGHGIVYFSFR